MGKADYKTYLPNKAYNILLFLLPSLYLIAGCYFRNLLGNLSLRSCDPDYIYFISGLTLSDGTLKLGHFDNPGTPLQIMIALVFKLTYFLRATSVPYIEDVLSHSDLYLSVTSLFIAGLTAGLLFYAGKKVYQFTGSVFYALIIQTAPFLPVIWYDLIGRIAPELLMPFPVILLSVYIIKIYYESKDITYRQISIFSLLAALGLSIKLTFLPLWFIPLVIIKGFKQKTVFFGLSVFFFLLIAFPVTLQLDFFWGWVKNLLLHSGQYGGGEPNFVDLSNFRSNISQLFGLERNYFYVLFCMIAAFSGHLLILRKKSDPGIVRLTVAVFVAIIIQLIMMGKHFEHRYFIPVLMLSPLIVFIVSELIRKISPGKITIVIINAGIVFFLLWHVENNHHWLKIKTEAMGSDIEQRLPTWHFASTLEKESYKIICSQNYGCPFIEYTLMYSMAWACNAKKAEYSPILRKLYPFTYNYFTWDNTLRYWGEEFDIVKIVHSGKKVYLYLEQNKEELFNKTIAKLMDKKEGLFTVDKEMLFLNPKTTEIIYQLVFRKSVTKQNDR